MQPRAVRAVAICLVLSSLYDLATADGHAHSHHHTEPLLELNETEVTLEHAPTPPSYYTIDWEDPTQKHHYPGLMILHILLMSLAFFAALPLGIAMRSVKHAWHAVAVLAFYAFSILGISASGLYSKLTPNMYEGSAHGVQGYFVLAMAVALTFIDLCNIAHRVLAYFRSDEKFSLASFWSTAILGREQLVLPSTAAEYTGLVTEEPEDLQERKAPKRVHYDPDQEDDPSSHTNPAQWVRNVHRHRHQYSQSGASDGTVFGNRSMHSDDTLNHDESEFVIPKKPLLLRIGSVVFAVCERTLVIAGFAQVLTGVVVYTGGCRENYLNGCLAHLIKGGIFWCYGLLTFARFLGTFSEYGWSWNRAPSGSAPSAEFVESLVIFLYGISNTWMERFGAKSGDPYTAKQIEHIGIAVMFWFAGLLGMAMESKRVRSWLAASTISALQPSKLSQKAIAEPPSYAASFNPFPALVIGITGAAMAAHTQTYVFQVQIHELWGNLLVAFSVMRWLTYFFLWLGPPRSILPSRPPTEALGGFFLAGGGMAFMLSTEEVTIAAMRRGKDDLMMFVTVTVAMTCIAFCWTITIVGFKGWLRSRLQPKISYHSSA